MFIIIIISPKNPSHWYPYFTLSFQNLEQSSEAGCQKLQDSTTMAENVLTLTSPPGQEVIKRSISSQQNDQTLLNQQTNQAKSQLEAVLQKWEEHDEGCKKLSDWLTEAESMIVNLEKPCMSLEEKKTQLEKLMVRKSFYCPTDKSNLCFYFLKSFNKHRKY